MSLYLYGKLFTLYISGVGILDLGFVFERSIFLLEGSVFMFEGLVLLPFKHLDVFNKLIVSVLVISLMLEG